MQNKEKTDSENSDDVKGLPWTVYLREDGQWACQRNDSDRPTSLHSTQKSAINEAKKLLRIQGGGYLGVMGRDGEIKNKIKIIA